MPSIRPIVSLIFLLAIKHLASFFFGLFSGPFFYYTYVSMTDWTWRVWWMRKFLNGTESSERTGNFFPSPSVINHLSFVRKPSDITTFRGERRKMQEQGEATTLKRQTSPVHQLLTFHALCVCFSPSAATSSRCQKQFLGEGRLMKTHK